VCQCFIEIKCLTPKYDISGRGTKESGTSQHAAILFRVYMLNSNRLVKHNSESFDFAPAGVEKLYLESPDEMLMEFLPTFDVVVVSSGHWFMKQSVYILNNDIVGGQLWWPDKSRLTKINSVEAFGISVETILTALVTHPNYTELTILRSLHYEGGRWNTGGSCTGKVKPLAVGELVENKYLLRCMSNRLKVLTVQLKRRQMVRRYG
jgi:hypothetical protein